MSKIVVIHGQNHRETSYHIARALVQKLADGETVTEFFLPRDMPEFCCGCYRCILKDKESCPHQGTMQPILRAMLDADLLIFSTPVYCMRASGSMKAFLDHCFSLWMIHQPDRRMFFKKAAIVSVGAGGGMKSAAKDIRTSVDNWGVLRIWTYGIPSGAMSWETVKDTKKARIERGLTKLAGKIRRSDGAHVRLGQKFHFVCMRLMHIKDWDVPEDKAYWEKLGWLGKGRPWKA